jgi:hypothetical protein
MSFCMVLGVRPKIVNITLGGCRPWWMWTNKAKLGWQSLFFFLLEKHLFGTIIITQVIIKMAPYNCKKYNKINGR